MWNSLFRSSVLSVVFVVVCGNISTKVTTSKKNPDYPNKCWDAATETAYSIGTHNRKDSCQRIHCYPDFRIKYTSCGTHSAAQGYTIEQDLSKGYPDCCAKLVKMERKFKRVDYDSGTVKINKFKGRERSFGKMIERNIQSTEKTIETTSSIDHNQGDTTKSVPE